MVKAITPFSTRAKEGATDAPLGDFVKVEQEIISTAKAGFYDKNTGKLEGVVGSDKLFVIDAIQEAIPNGGTITSPQGAGNAIDMTGYNDLFFAILPTKGGDYQLTAIMSGDTSYSNLTPINGGGKLRFCGGFMADGDQFTDVLDDTAETLAEDVWNIYCIQNRARNQKTFQIKTTNDTGGNSDLTFAYLRVV